MKQYFDEDRRGISIGYDQERMMRLKPFAIDILKSDGIRHVSQKIHKISPMCMVLNI